MAENDSKSETAMSRKERRKQWWSKHQKQQQTDDSEESTSKADEPSPPVTAERIDGFKTSETNGEESSEKKKTKKKNKFYVLFVGQIPFNATEEDITKHFSKAGELKSVRLATHKDTGKSRGFGYIEFKNNKSYMNGLAMHLSKLHGRPVNVEITSPGRGTSLFRKENLKRKNEEMARFRGMLEGETAGGAMCILASKPQSGGGNKKQKFTKGKR